MDRFYRGDRAGVGSADDECDGALQDRGDQAAAFAAGDPVPDRVGDPVCADGLGSGDGLAECPRQGQKYFHWSVSGADHV